MGHRGRLKDRARREGIESLRPHEVVELMLYQGMPRTDMADVARRVMDRFGTVEAVLQAGRKELMSVEGMTSQAAAWVLRTGDMLRMFLDADSAVMPQLWRVKDLVRRAADLRSQARPPQTWMLYTDYDHRLLMQAPLCDSLYWADPMYALEIVRQALSLQASHAFILCFAGVELLELADYERDFLGQLADTLRAVGVELLDCMMVGEDEYLSLNQSGDMDVIRQNCLRPWLHEHYIGEDEDACGESPDL